jgi:hypothetical protein
MPDNDKIQLPKGFKLDESVETPNVKLPKGFTLDTEVVKKKVGGEESSLTKSQLDLPDFEKGKAFAEKGFLMQAEGTKAPKTKEKIEPVEGQGLLLNTVSALDKGFYKNFISSPIKGLGTALQGATKKVLGGTGEGFVSNKLIQFGDYLNKTIDELTPQDEEFKGTLTDQVAQAFGQVGSLIATGGIAGAAGKGSALVSQIPKGSAAATAAKTLGSQLASPTAVSAGLSMGQAEFDRAKEAGANDDQAFEAFYKNASVGSVLETIPVMQFFKRFNNTTGGSVANYIKTKGVAGITGGIEEMTTEVLQQIYSNKTAKDIYNINQDILDGVGSSGGIGFGVGFVLNAMGANAKILRKQGKEQEADVLENQIKQYEDNLENPKVTSDKKAVTKDIVTQGVEIGTQKAVQSLDRDLANNVITPEQYQEGIVFTEKAAQVVDKIPETVTGESKVKSVELLVERNDIKEANQILLQQKQATDEAYHAGIDQEIKANEEKIKKLDTEVYNIAKSPSKEFGTKKYVVDGEEVSQAEFEALQGKPLGTKEVIKAEVKPAEVKVTEEVKPTEVKIEDVTSKQKDEKFDAPTLKSPASNYEKLYVPRSVVEQAYKNDKDNNPVFGNGNQSLDTIIKRGGYSIEELNKLYPNWKESSKAEVKSTKVTKDDIEVEGLDSYTSTAKSGKFYNIFGKRKVGDGDEMWWIRFSRKNNTNTLGSARYRNEKGEEKVISLNELPKSLIEIYNNPVAEVKPTEVKQPTKELAEGEVKVFNAKDIKENNNALKEDSGYRTLGYPESFVALGTNMLALKGKGLENSKVGDVINIFNKDYVIDGFIENKNNPNETKVKLIRVDKDGNLLREQDLSKKEQKEGKAKEFEEEEEIGVEEAEQITKEEETNKQLAETELLLSGEAEKRRKEGKFTKDGIEYNRNEKQKGEVGNNGEVRFTNDVSLPFKYKLVEAETIQPSHENGIRNPLHFIPEAQPKNRNDVGSLQAEESFANNPRFEELGENTNAYSGSPVVNERGEVIQGNNRSAGLRKGYQRGNAQYKNDLANNAEKFGFTKEQVDNMNNPVLVREIAVSDVGAIELGNYDVKDLETGGKRRLDPVSITRRMPFELKGRISDVLFKGDDTLNKSLRDNSKKILELLSPYLNQSQRNTLFKDGVLTEAGAKDLEAVVQHFLFDGGDVALPDLFESLSYTQKEGLRKSLPNIFSTTSEKSITPQIQEAIIAINSFNESGIGNFDNWLSQTDMFNEGKTPNDTFSPTAIAIAKILNIGSQKEIAAEFAKYADAVKDKPATMFEEAQKGASKKEAIQQIFKTEYNETTEQKAIGTRGGKEAIGKQEAVEKTKPKPKSKPKPTESQAVKDYKEAVTKASKKAKENAKKEFVDRNFDLIIEKLKIQIKCPT